LRLYAEVPMRQHCNRPVLQIFFCQPFFARSPTFVYFQKIPRLDAQL